MFYYDLGTVDLCLESLKLLQNCTEIISMMYNMPKCPTFNLSHRVIIDTEPQLVDPVLKDSEIVSFNQIDVDQADYDLLSIQTDFKKCEASKITLNDLDTQSGVLKVYYILIGKLISRFLISLESI